MAYLCPVCEEPQVDAGHLANHLAFTAVIRGGDHEAWLDDTVPAWDDHEEAWLAEQVRERVEEVDHPVDEIETGGHDHGGHEGQHDSHEQGRSGGQRRGPRANPEVAGKVGGAALDEDAQSVVEEARELTRQMAKDEEDAPGDASTGDAPGDTATEDASGETSTGDAPGDASTGDSIDGDTEDTSGQ